MSAFHTTVVPVVTLLFTNVYMLMYGLCSFFGAMGSGGPTPAPGSCAAHLGFSIEGLLLWSVGISLSSYLFGRRLNVERKRSS